MKQSSSYFKRNALDSLRGKWVIAVIAFIIASILGGVASVSFTVSFNGGDTDGTVTNPGAVEFDSLQELIDSIPPTVWTVFIVSMVIGALVGIATYIIGSCIEVGYRKFNLDLVDRKNADLGTLFGYFSSFGKNLATRFLRDLYIFLWTLLFIVPGIMKTYSYAMTSYLRAEDPELGVNEAITKSKELMYGHRADLFILHLSFIGWYILALFTCGIAFPIVATYQHAAVADFFRELTGTRPAPAEGGFGTPPYGQGGVPPYGTPYGTPYGQGGTPYGTPYGNPNAQSPYGTPYGTPYGSPYGQGNTPYGAPYGTPYGQNNVPPTGNAPAPETPTETPAEAPAEAPAETPVEMPIETPATTSVETDAEAKNGLPDLPSLSDIEIPDVSEIKVDPDNKAE